MEPFSLAAIAGLVSTLGPLIKKGASEGASGIIDLLWNAFFSALDIPPDKMNIVRDKLFGSIPTAVSVVVHIIEDYNRGPDRGNATAWQIIQACKEAGMTVMQYSKVQMMWYYLWGNTAAAQGTKYYTFTHDNKLMGAVNGLSKPETDALFQYFALNSVGRANWLETCPVSKWTPGFRAGMIAAAKALGEKPVFGGVNLDGGGPSTSAGASSGAAVPLAIAALAAVAAMRGGR